MAIASPWRVSYHDGSANHYEIWSEADGAAFEYSPVTPERSSTGMYSGGAPRTGRLDASRIESLWQLVRELEADRSLQTTDRMKGTGAFTLTDPSGTRTFIIVMGPRLRVWDDLVAAL